ncbi:hypothetical protein [Leucobacter soli]|uniref:hypothetical protein n=1 Tax=Leucobacter soli TaxID=2812850 RepID=UPI003622F424
MPEGIDVLEAHDADAPARQPRQHTRRDALGQLGLAREQQPQDGGSRLVSASP